MEETCLEELRLGLETAFVNQNTPSAGGFRPSFLSNDYHEGKKVLAALEDELLSCDSFLMSVAFITMSGLTPLLQTLKELEARGIPGKILTTNYLSFSEPAALEKLHGLSNLQIRMYDAERGSGFHTKGYLFRQRDMIHIIIGSSNVTGSALTVNREWNLRVISAREGEVAEEILQEFTGLWDSEYALPYEDFIESYRQRYQIAKQQKKAALSSPTVSLESYRLQPNSMQVEFIGNLRSILEAGKNRALLISATGTGKTFASAFAMRELGFKKVLFLVHRSQLAVQTRDAYRKVFGNTVSMGLVGGGHYEYDKDFVFATIQTLNRDAHLFRLSPDAFDAVILDEAHHSSANTYQKILSYFHPRLWLGMTATPDRREEGNKSIYEIFDHQIACEIRLAQAMEEDLLCPFHYFGISDLQLVGDSPKELSPREFARLVSDERVRHILEMASYYGCSGDRVKGLIFCSRIEETKELSSKFNRLGYRTLALNGDAPEELREEAFERLAMEETESRPDRTPLDYIFSVDILNEGVDIVEVNQVILLRPTQSPVVFIQQLGRGLRKAPGKEYVVILDFIGNYQRNFLIPVALSGDRSYNPDSIRRYVISGNRTIPGASTVHFDEVARERIFHSIDRMRGFKALIRESFQNLKDRLGRIPRLLDFYENQEIDPLVIIREYKTYYDFLLTVEKETFQGKLTEAERLTLEYLSKTILSGVRPHELAILEKLLSEEKVEAEEIQNDISLRFAIPCTLEDVKNAVRVLEGHFVSKESEYEKYRQMEILILNPQDQILRMAGYQQRLSNEEFRQQIRDLVETGLRRYQDQYAGKSTGPFVLYEKYSRRDVSLLMNCGRDLSSTMYGMKRIGEDVFIFITYHKAEKEEESMQYAQGKPDYADAFSDTLTFRWDSQIGKGPGSSYMKDVTQAPRKHLLVKKSDAETGFYYMGTFDITEISGSEKMDNRGKMQPITKVTMRMHHPVREDLLKYLESSLKGEDE